MDTKKFKDLEGSETRTKTVSGLTLVMDPDLKRFVLPTQTDAGKRILYDEASGQFVEVLLANGGGFMYRERTATSPDGTGLSERVLVATNGSAAAAEAVTQEAIAAGEMKLKKQLIEAATGIVPLLFLGAAVTVVVFFAKLVGKLDVIVAAIAEGSKAALAEIGYWAAWAAGGALALFLLFRLVVFAFRYSPEDECEVQGNRNDTSGRTVCDATVTNIYVSNARNVSGGFASTAAQDFVNNRNI
jgi:hypothetical protein